jgi:hypothetical protein
MVALPELLLRWSLGEARLRVPAEWSREPDRVPGRDDADVGWAREWVREVPPAPDGASRSLVSRLGALLPPTVREPLRRARADRRTAHLPPGFRPLDWQPATWYADRWRSMRAFALPSFYDGRIRVNLRGREADGIVDLADYERVCDEVEALLRACVDPRTGASVVESVDRPARGDPRGPMGLDRSLADVVVVWAAAPLAFCHPEHGTIGPVPYRRTGGHTSPHGFVSVTGPDVVPGDHGVASALDVAPTIFELLAGRPPEGISGTSRFGELTGAR